MEALKNYNKGKAFAEKLIRGAKRERDANGYRENLGYDQANKLSDFLSKLNLSYHEKSDIEIFFDSACDEI